MVKKEKLELEGGLWVSEMSLKELGFSPEILNELYDAITQTKQIIDTYYDSSSRFPSSMRDNVGRLMIEADLLLLAFNDLYVTASGMMEKLKRKYLLKQKVKRNKKEEEQFLRQLEFLKLRVKKLIQETEGYVREVKNYHKKHPLPL
jgi:hypothetical protein